MEKSILWYDLETFGVNPRQDRIAQFAALRSNLELEQVGEPILLYCKLSDDYLPNPEACLVTGITPQECAQKGLSEYEFAQRIFDCMMVPGTTVAGYNSTRFDDEFIRSLFYRNLFDPYLREYANGNSRWDIINLARACRDLRPEGIQWPQTEKNGITNYPFFTLEALAEANNIAHSQAHNALSDVQTTLGLARLIRHKQQRLYDWSFKHRTKESLRKLFDLNTRPALVYSTAELTRGEGCSTLICPIGVPGEKSGQGRNSVLCADLRYDPEQILSKSAQEIHHLIFLSRAMEDNEQKRFPIYNIRINQAPFVAPLQTMGQAEAEKLGIDIDQCLKHRNIYLKHHNLSAKIHEAFNVIFDPSKFIEKTLPPDPDYQLYDSFIEQSDRERLNEIHDQLGIILSDRNRDRAKNASEHNSEASGIDRGASQNAQKNASDQGAHTRKSTQTEIHNLMAHVQGITFVQREKLSKLFNRLIGRSFSEYLSGKAAQNWRDFCQNRLLFPLLDDAMDIKKFESSIREKQKGASLKQKLILKDLLLYAKELKARVLTVSSEKIKP